MKIKRLLVYLGSLGAILGGLFAFILQLELEFNFIMFLIALVLSWVAVFVGLLVHGGVSRLGRFGLWFAISGLSMILILTIADELFNFDQVSLPWEIFLVSFFTIPLGLVMYGIDSLRFRPLKRGNGLPFLILTTIVVVIVLNVDTWLAWMQQLAFFIFGISWISLGVALWYSSRREQDQASSGRVRSRPVIIAGISLGLVVLSIQAYIWQANAAKTTCSVPTTPLTIRQDAELSPVIIDADMAHEDAHAILYLLQHPGVDVQAITVSGTGEAHCAPGVKHAQGLLALHGVENVPVSCGMETPLRGDHAFPQTWRQEADDLYGLSLPQNPNPPASIPADQLIAEVASESDQKVSLIALGPLTNLAKALQTYPSMVENLDSIYIMGGAVRTPGNVGLSGVGIDNQFAEWNIYIDPTAANIVLASGVPITMVPLNATKDVPITTDLYRCIQENRDTPEADFVYRMLRANYDFVTSGGFQFWDSLTAAIYTNPELAALEEMKIIVEQENDSRLGYTYPSESGHPVRVALNARAKQFEALFLAVLNGDF